MTTAANYTDFNLQLRGLNDETGRFEVAVLPSSEIEGTRDPVEVDHDADELQDNLYFLERKETDLQDLITLGEALAKRLLPTGKVRDLFKQAVAKTSATGGVRLRLLIHDPRLAQLPWEYTYLPLHDGEKDRSHFLVLHPKVSIVRHEVLEEEYAPLSSKDSTLRLAIALANVKDKKYPPLKLDKERQAIEAALDDKVDDSITLEHEVLENATVETLQALLARKADLFHFAGHGDFTETGITAAGEPIGIGSLVLLKDPDTRAAAPLTASELALALAAAGVRVVVLGACNTGRRDGVSAWTGVAPALIEKGIPAVVAMQYEVNDSQASAFSRMFYTSLAVGLSIDEAVAAGRRAMALESNSDQNVEWGVPVLYLRSRDGVLFPRPVEQESKVATDLRLFAKADINTIEGGKFRVMEIGKISRANAVNAELTTDTAKDADVVVLKIDEA